MPPDEQEGRPGGDTETADQKTSHDQATSATDSNRSGRHRLPRINVSHTAAIDLDGHFGSCRSTVPPAPAGSPVIGYAEAQGSYLAAGWTAPLPLKRGTKGPPPSGFTGKTGAYPNEIDLAVWRETVSDGNLALRLPDRVEVAGQLWSVIGLDEDHYGGKTGAQTIAEGEKRYGLLPPTPYSTSRTDGSRIRLYRIPAGIKLHGVLKFGDLNIGDVEIIQYHHRYMLCWPSIHDKTGWMYQWFDAHGVVMDGPPRVEDIAVLPAPWIEGLRIDKPHNNSQPHAANKTAPPKREASILNVTEAMTEGQPSPKVARRLAEALTDLPQGLSRHDTVRDHVMALLRYGRNGEPGVEVALRTLYCCFVDAVAADRVGGEAEAEAEFIRMVSNAEALLASEPTQDTADIDTEPVPLTQTVAVPVWPVDALPKSIADMVNAVAEATQTDPAMPATSVLSALSACTGGHAEIEIRSGWREPLCLYTATIAAPGERKSAVQMFMTRPIHDVERQLVADTAADRLAAEERKQVATKAVERQRNAAARADGEQAQAAFDAVIGAAQIADGIQVPPVPRLLADDCTPEAAASLLAEQGGRLAIISAEGGIFDIIAGRYSPKAMPNMDLWLKGHSGDPLRVDRKGRPSEHIPRPALTLGLMIQPAVLHAIAANQQFRGRGFLARILYARPISKVGHRKIPATPIDPQVEQTYGATLKKLAGGMRGWVGDPAVLILTPGAQEEMRRVEAAVEPTLAGDGELASLADWGGKLVGAVARIAGILHLAEHGAEKGPREPVSAQTIVAAERIGEYYKASAINAFTEMGTDQGTADAIYLLERIRYLGQDEVSERDLYRAAKRLKTKQDLRPPLDRLIDQGYLVRLPTPESTGGRPASARYRVTKLPEGPKG
jgi:replicative DNA helicase